MREPFHFISPTDKQIKEWQVERRLLELKPRQEKILRLRYGIGCRRHTYQEIGDQFYLSRERIRQIEHRALRDLNIRRELHASE